MSQNAFGFYSGAGGQAIAQELAKRADLNAQKELQLRAQQIVTQSLSQGQNDAYTNNYRQALSANQTAQTGQIEANMLAAQQKAIAVQNAAKNLPGYLQDAAVAGGGAIDPQLRSALDTEQRVAAFEQSPLGQALSQSTTGRIDPATGVLVGGVDNSQRARQVFDLTGGDQKQIQQLLQQDALSDPAAFKPLLALGETYNKALGDPAYQKTYAQKLGLEALSPEQTHAAAAEAAFNSPQFQKLPQSTQVWLRMKYQEKGVFGIQEAWQAASQARSELEKASLENRKTEAETREANAKANLTNKQASLEDFKAKSDRIKAEKSGQQGKDPVTLAFQVGKVQQLAEAESKLKAAKTALEQYVPTAIDKFDPKNILKLQQVVDEAQAEYDGAKAAVEGIQAVTAPQPQPQPKPQPKSKPGLPPPSAVIVRKN